MATHRVSTFNRITNHSYIVQKSVQDRFARLSRRRRIAFKQFHTAVLQGHVSSLLTCVGE